MATPPINASVRSIGCAMHPQVAKHTRTVGAVQGRYGNVTGPLVTRTSAAMTMANISEDKQGLIDQVSDYPLLYDVPLRPDSDEFTCQNS